MNQNQKIKYVLRLKEDNNALKKQLAKTFNEMSKLADYSVHDKEKEVHVLSEKLKKQRGDLDKAHDHSRTVTKNSNKLCDYILTRAVYPESFKVQTREVPKIKAAIEGVTLMARLIQKKDKELQTLRKSNEDQKALLHSSKRENKVLMRNMGDEGSARKRVLHASQELNSRKY